MMNVGSAHSDSSESDISGAFPGLGAANKLALMNGMKGGIGMGYNGKLLANGNLMNGGMMGIPGMNNNNKIKLENNFW